MLPVTASPEVRTVTWVSVPPAAVTVIPADGSACLAPFAGVIVTRGAATPAPDVAPLPAAAVWPAALTWVVPCPPPEHPAATSASTVTAATPATRRPVIVPAARIPAPFPRTTFCIRYRAPSFDLTRCRREPYPGRSVMPAGRGAGEAAGSGGPPARVSPGGSWVQPEPRQPPRRVPIRFLRWLPVVYYSHSTKLLVR
jgi:hypothetical protein